MSNPNESLFQPKVSIVIPVYNGADFMREAIDSALAQTYRNIEVLVVNDGSRDEGATREVALSYGDRIRYFEKENGGVSSALNLGIRNMTGEYFSWLSHDDVYLPDKVQKSVACLGSLPDRERVIAFCGSSHINIRSEVIREEVERFDHGRVYTGEEVLLYLLQNHMMNMCCMLIPRRTFEECELFHEGLRYNQDALMLYRIFSTGHSMVAHTDDRMVRYRLHANQTSKTRRDLLLHDSNVAAEIIAPVFASLNTKKINFLRLYAGHHAKQACKEALNTCIRIGKRMRALGFWDIVALRMKLIWGYVRGVLKKIYHAIRF
jgi:glycosyltransferase involved in cell wall biosynthesis